MARFRQGGRTSAATAGLVAGDVAAQFWNPHTDAMPRVTEIHVTVTAAAAAHVAVQRSTIRGSGLLTTPDSDSNLDRTGPPPSGAAVEFAAFTVQPTLDATVLQQWNLPAFAGSAVMLTPTFGIAVPPGTGLCVVSPVAVAFPISDIAFVWSE